MKSKKLTLLLELAHGNLGAINALSDMFSHDCFWAMRLKDRMEHRGLTGSKIWVGFKFCKFSASKFMTKIACWDKRMIRHINKIISHGGCGNQMAL